MPENVLSGNEALRLWYRDGSTWREFKLAQDLDHDESPDMLEASVRGSRLKRYIRGMAEGKLATKLLKVTGEASYEFLRAALDAGDDVELAWTEGPDIATQGTVYGRDWFIFTWKNGAPLNGTPTIDIEFSPTIHFVDGELVERSYETVA